jgi:stage V sporulation protein AE
MEYIKAFLIGGILCLIGQLLIDKTKLTPARILVCYVVAGVLLSAAGLYEKLVNLAGAGATVPLTGFGHAIARGVKEAVNKYGFLGIFIGGLEASAGGITAAIFFALMMSTIFNLSNTIIGSGTLSIPLAFYYSGYLGGTLLLILAWALSAYGMHLLTYASV